MALKAETSPDSPTATLPWLHEPLRLALAMQRSHALLVQAAAGVGGFEFMLALAKGWLCEGEGGETRPCGRCAS